jgi:superfamily I DNA/RNA helicase
VINNLYEGPTPQSFGLDGIEPIFTRVNTHDDAAEKICAEILKLNKEEGVDFSSIAVLSENKDFLRRIERTLNSVGVFHNTAKFRGLNIITLDSVLNFKGLESPFVIIYSDLDTSNSRALSYVSTSRARTYLHVYSNDQNTIISKAMATL